MKPKERLLDRVARLVPYYLAGALVGAGCLYAESRVFGTVLMVPTFNWTSRSIPGATLASAAGEYSVSFKHTRLDWRLVSRGAGVVGPAFTAGTRAGWRLHVWETAPGTGAELWGEALPGAPGLRRSDDGVVRGSFRAGSKDVTLEFAPPPGGADPDENVLADILSISRSLKPSEIKTGPGE
jgi:hypothetical protein